MPRTYVYAYKANGLIVLDVMTFNVTNQTEAVEQLIKSDQRLREQLVRLYSLDGTVLEDIFCDQDFKFDPRKIASGDRSESLIKFDEYTNEYELTYETNEEELDFLKKLEPNEKLSKDNLLVNIKYCENKIKYNQLISAFWGRDEIKVKNLEGDNLERLAQILIRDHLIKIKEIQLGSKIKST